MVGHRHETQLLIASNFNYNKCYERKVEYEKRIYMRKEMTKVKIRVLTEKNGQVDGFEK